MPLLSSEGMEGPSIQVIRVEGREIADPSPLGLAAFALTTFILAAHNAGWAPDLVWISVALFYGGIAQFAAGMWAFKLNATFEATAFTSYGAQWLALALFILFQLTGLIPPTYPVRSAVGWFCASFLIFNTYMLVCSLLKSKAVTTVFLFVELTLMCLAIGNLKGEVTGGRFNWIVLGGYSGVATSIIAWYTSAAICFNVTAKRTIFPIGKPFLNLTRSGGEETTKSRVGDAEALCDMA